MSEFIDLEARRKQRDDTLHDESKTRRLELESRYLKQAAELSAQAALGLGLDSRFLDILKKHVTDLNLKATEKDSEIGSHLTLEKVDDGFSVKFKRKAYINPSQVNLYAQALEDSLSTNDACVDIDDDAVSALALDWVLYELCADAIGNSCYMQRHFGSYIGDYNGQNPYDKAASTVSQIFLETYAQDGYTPDDVFGDHEGFRSGFAIHLLSEGLIRRGLCTTVKQTEWITKSLSDEYPNYKKPFVVTPLRYDEMLQRCTSISPIDVRYEMAGYLRSYNLGE